MDGREGEGGDSQEEELEAEEARPARKVQTPCLPSAADVEEHNKTHLPYRSWCPFCVKGRKDRPAHATRPKVGPECAEIGLDYCYIRRAGEEQCITVLVTKDRFSRALRAAVLRYKGTCMEESVGVAVAAVKDMGYHSKVFLKVDEERALVALREAVMKKLPHAAQAVRVPLNESQSNGNIENAVKLFKGVLRVYLLALEHRIQGHIPSEHAAISWLVQHAANNITMFLVGADGKTAYQRMYGKNAQEETYEFGERVHCRLPQSQISNVELESRWQDGIWLGKEWNGISHYVAISPETVIRTRSVHRKPEGERWKREEVEALRCYTWGAAPADTEPVVIPARPAEESPVEVRPEASYRPNQLGITRADLVTHGFTQGCRRCQLTRNGEAVHGSKHTQQCRRRIEGMLRDAGDPRVTRADARIVQAACAAAPAAEEERGEEVDSRAEPRGELQGARPGEEPQPPQDVQEPQEPAEGDQVGEDVEVEMQEDNMEVFELRGPGGRKAPKEMCTDATRLYELLLTHGCDARQAKSQNCTPRRGSQHYCANSRDFHSRQDRLST